LIIAILNEKKLKTRNEAAPPAMNMPQIMIGRRFLLCIFSIVPAITKKEYRTMVQTRRVICLWCLMNTEFVVAVIRASSSVENLLRFSETSLNRSLTTFIERTQKG